MTGGKTGILMKNVKKTGVKLDGYSRKTQN